MLGRQPSGQALGLEGSGMVFSNSTVYLYSSFYLKSCNKPSENIKLISVHVPKHARPKSDDQFGHYLAGLIDGQGWLSKDGVHIGFHRLDASLAYFIKGRIGYGSVIKLEKKDGYLLSITHPMGLENTLNFINRKLRTPSKCDAVYKYLIDVFVESLSLKEKFEVNCSENLNNHWLAGFLDVKGYFQVKCTRVNSPTGTHLEVSLNLDVYQETRLLLDLIKNKLGGNIVFLEDKNQYLYSSISFGSAQKLIDYLNKYHMSSSKYVNYIKWRKAYQIVQEKRHHTPKGQDKMLKIESSIVDYSKVVIDPRDITVK